MRDEYRPSFLESDDGGVAVLEAPVKTDTDRRETSYDSGILSGVESRVDQGPLAREYKQRKEE
jgi:hypothetical protein